MFIEQPSIDPQEAKNGSPMAAHTEPILVPLL